MQYESAASSQLAVVEFGFQHKQISGEEQNSFRPVSPPLLDSFPIVGIGDSGAGLEAFTESLKTPSRQQKLFDKLATDDRQ